MSTEEQGKSSVPEDPSLVIVSDRGEILRQMTLILDPDELFNLIRCLMTLREVGIETPVQLRDNNAKGVPVRLVRLPSHVDTYDQVWQCCRKVWEVNPVRLDDDPTTTDERRKILQAVHEMFLHRQAKAFGGGLGLQPEGESAQVPDHKLPPENSGPSTR